MAVGEVGVGRRVGAKLPLTVVLTPLLLLLASPSPAHGHASGTSLLSNCIFTANVTSPNPPTSPNVTSVDPPNVQPNVATDLTVRLSVRVELSEDYAGRAWQIARHDTHFEPSFLELRGILCRGEQYLFS